MKRVTNRRMTAGVCGSIWFARFIDGCKSRMGQVHKPNQAMNNELISLVLRQVELRISNSTNLEEVHDWAIFSCYTVACYCLSLRCNEGFSIDLGTMSKFRRKDNGSYVVFSLLGKVKGERNQCTHLIPCIPITGSGIRVRDV